MKFALAKLGKEATIIKGDSEIPEAFKHFPGASEILMKSFWEIKPVDYDLFIILDSDIGGVSRLKKVELPKEMMVINIDHHKTNSGQGRINIVDSTYPATAQLLFDIFRIMEVNITPEIAANLFMGIFTDTGFKYEGTSSATFEVASILAKIYPAFPKLISIMENSNTLDDIAFRGMTLSSIESFYDDKVLLSVIPYELIREKKIPDVSVSAGSNSVLIRTVKGVEIAGVLIEPRPGRIKMSFRSGGSETCDVSRLAVALGGGGHRLAAGVDVEMSLPEAKIRVVEKIKELYNL